MSQTKLTLLILTCDKFSDLWDSHVKLLNTNWEDRLADTILVTDKNTNRKFDNVKVICAGEGKEFSEKIDYALKIIDSEYILVTLDDYFPINKIHNSEILNLLEVIDKEKIDYMRLFPDPNCRYRYNNYKKIYRLQLNVNYDVNLYQGIWRKSFFEKTVQNPLNAWQYEVSLTEIARNLNANCALSKGREFEILDVVRKGKLLHKANRYLKRNNLYNGNREIIKYSEEFRIFVFNRGKKILPKFIAKLLKKTLISCGYSFYSDSI